MKRILRLLKYSAKMRNRAFVSTRIVGLNRPYLFLYFISALFTACSDESKSIVGDSKDIMKKDGVYSFKVELYKDPGALSKDLLFEVKVELFSDQFFASEDSVEFPADIKIVKKTYCDGIIGASMFMVSALDSVGKPNSSGILNFIIASGESKFLETRAENEILNYLHRSLPYPGSTVISTEDKLLLKNQNIGISFNIDILYDSSGSIGQVKISPRVLESIGSPNEPYLIGKMSNILGAETTPLYLKYFGE